MKDFLLSEIEDLAMEAPVALETLVRDLPLDSLDWATVIVRCERRSGRRWRADWQNIRTVADLAEVFDAN
jgi:acyl carrier protein